MTEDGGHGADGATVDSVTGLLATRLGAVGESAGEVVRRDVRTAAGGAESIALLVQADTDGAGRFSAQLPDALGHIAGGTDIGPVPDASAGPQRIPADRLEAGEDPPVPPGPAGTDVLPGASQAGPADVRRTPAGGDSAQDGEAGTPGPGPAVVPGSEPPEKTSAPQPVPEQEPAVEAVAADPAQQPGIPPAALGEAPPSGTPSQTPWTAAHSGSSPEPSRDDGPGTTPWNSGTHAAPPHIPGMPGGLPSLPTPQERPSRGNPPWSRGRGGGTVFPRARPEEQLPGRVDRLDGATWPGPGRR